MKNEKTNCGHYDPSNYLEHRPRGLIIPENYAQHSVDVGGLTISFQRTVRVPEGKLNSLPAGLGNFPVYKVSDFDKTAPKEWNREGYFIPMYAQEAMWMSFGHSDAPKALVVGAGNINAITGKPFDPSKTNKRAQSGLDLKLEKEQNYMVTPTQPWLDGWKAEDGKVYQFVAAELGSGQTVEGQITGEETAGGIQFIVYDALKDKLPKIERPHLQTLGGYGGVLESFACCDSAPKALRCAGNSVQSMGLGRGGEIDQKVYPDPYGLEVWKKKPTAVELIHIVSSEDFEKVTGYKAPSTPVTFETYQRLGYPWFELFDKHYKDTEGSDVFGNLKPVDGGQKDPFNKLQPKKDKLTKLLDSADLDKLQPHEQKGTGALNPKYKKY
ncbi:hypothetical protein HZA97_09490 [Candidatus Woesearchaeota archaeon]|nr:hypothetical protein [Candidatus Woesearchaeota archaeon]